MLHDLTPIPFVVAGALRGRTTATGYNTPTAHFRNRRCLARCRRRLGCAFALKPAEEASSITFQIGRRGSRHQHPLPDRPPALQAFRSVLSRTPSVSTQRLSRLPFVPPSPRSSIPESADMIPYQRVISQSAREEILRPLRSLRLKLSGTRQDEATTSPLLKTTVAPLLLFNSRDA